jgi:hypothetical protein
MMQPFPSPLCLSPTVQHFQHWRRSRLEPLHRPGPSTLISLATAATLEPRLDPARLTVLPYSYFRVSGHLPEPVP